MPVHQGSFRACLSYHFNAHSLMISLKSQFCILSYISEKVEYIEDCQRFECLQLFFIQIRMLCKKSLI